MGVGELPPGRRRKQLGLLVLLDPVVAELPGGMARHTLLAPTASLIWAPCAGCPLT